MSSLPTSDLLLRWTQEDLTVEQAVGQLVQIIHAQQLQLQETRQRLRALEEQRAAQPSPAPDTPAPNLPQKQKKT